MSQVLCSISREYLRYTTAEYHWMINTKEMIYRLVIINDKDFLWNVNNNALDVHEKSS